MPPPRSPPRALPGPTWAAHSNAYRIEALRRFANVVRKKESGFAELIARETGKPLWESKTEVGAVVNKVEISIEAYGERTPQRRMEAALGNKIAVRHKPHGVLAVLGPYNFPAHLPNGHIVPALIAGNAVVFKPSEKTPAVGELLVHCFHEAGIPEGVVRLLIGGPDQGRALAGQPGIDGLLFTGSARAGMALHKQFAETPHKILALELGGNNPLVVWHAKDIDSGGGDGGPIGLSVGRPALHRGAAADRRGRQARSPDRGDREADRPDDRRRAVRRSAAVHGTADRPCRRRPRPGTMAEPDDEGRQADPPARPADAETPFLTPGADRRHRHQGPARRGDFRPRPAAVRVKDFDAAIAEANNTRFGLAASLIGGSPEMYDKFWANVRAGVINWNKPTNGAPSNAPFGGIGLSGNHRPSAFYAADYCAYPVTSSEADRPRATIAKGLRDPEHAGRLSRCRLSGSLWRLAAFKRPMSNINGSARPSALPCAAQL